MRDALDSGDAAARAVGAGARSTPACAKATATCASCWCTSARAPTPRTSSRRCRPRCASSSTRAALKASAADAGPRACRWRRTCRSRCCTSCRKRCPTCASMPAPAQVWLDVQQQPQLALRGARRRRRLRTPTSPARRRDPRRPAHHGRARRAHRRHARGASRRPGAARSVVLTLPPAAPRLPTRRGGRGRRQRCMTDGRAGRAADPHPGGRRPHAVPPRPDGAAGARSAARRWWATRPTPARRSAAPPELQPDLILLDNHLPGVNGVDALPALREAAPAARILMLTVSEDEQDLAAALRGGACGYLLKTIEGDALVTAIHARDARRVVVAEEMTGKLVAAYRDAAAAPAGAAPTRRLADRAAVAARARHPARHRARRQQQGDRPRARHRRDHGQDPRAARAAQARPELARAGGGGGHGARPALTRRGSMTAARGTLRPWRRRPRQARNLHTA